MPAFRQLYVAAPGADVSGIDARPPGLPAAQARRARHRRHPLPVAVEPDPRLQGDAHHRPARAVLPRPVATRASPARWPWCTRGSPPTPSRRGRSPTRIASSPTTARSTPCAATATGCTPASRSWPRDLIPGDLEQLYPDLHAGRQRLGVLRRGARAAAPRRTLTAARGPDDDPGGVGEPHVDGPRPPRLLRLSRDAHGALGRPRVRILH